MALVRQMMSQPGFDKVEALLTAPFIDNPDKTVNEQITEAIAKLGENIIVKRVARFDLPAEGVLDSYIHIGGRVGVLIEVLGASGDKVTELAHDLTLQIAAASPRFVNEDDVPSETIEAERNIYRAQLAEEKKPDNIKERIIDGKLKKWYGEVALMNQEFVKDNDFTIGKLVDKFSREVGQPLTVTRFARFELGTD
jgi:elongation factor Ts